MVTLIIVGFLAGVITSISPCVLPVLPVVLASGTGAAWKKAELSEQSIRPQRTTEATDATDATDATVAVRTHAPIRTFSWRPYLVILGLILSFSLSTLFGSLVLSALHLSQDLLRDGGIAVLILIGISFMFPRVSDLIEKPFSRIRGRSVNAEGNGLVLGLGLGLLFVPCAGPVLATIAVVGATHHVSFGALVLTAAFGIGAGVPLLILALAGDAIVRRTAAVRNRARSFRFVGGAVMVLVAAAIAFNLTDALQRNVPGYTAALQNKVESNSNATKHLNDLTVAGKRKSGSSADAEKSGPCSVGASALVDCGQAPAITGINGWLNTRGDKPLSLRGLRGKVVLLDFWTYSCINCQRTLPYLEKWYSKYHKDGLEIIGVHTPEFAFEHVTANVKAQAASLGVKYPIAIDNDYATWNAYSNQYWPAEYLIDATGIIRHVSFGEGGYSATENLIRNLLTAAGSHAPLSALPAVPDSTPLDVETPETYLGYHYAPLHIAGQAPAHDKARRYSFPAKLGTDKFGLSGTWTSRSEQLTAGKDAKLELNFAATKAYLVMDGSGTVRVSINGKPQPSVDVAGVPRLYTVAKTDGKRSVVTLTVPAGVSAYDFTFG